VPTTKSVLVPDRQSLAFPVLFALVAHVGLAAGIIAASNWSLRTRKPVLDPSEVMEVSMIVLPRTDRSMVQAARRAPVQRGDTMDAPRTPSQPDPVKTSDLTVASPTAEQTRGRPDRSAERNARMRQMMMQQLLEGLEDAPEGDADVQAADPNSTSDVGYNTGGRGSAGDPEMARYYTEVRKLFFDNFNPLPAIAMTNPDISCTVHVEVDPATGRVLSSSVTVPSGNASWDGAAQRAVAAVTTIPLPPEKYRHLLAGGYDVVFNPE